MKSEFLNASEFTFEVVNNVQNECQKIYKVGKREQKISKNLTNSFSNLLHTAGKYGIIKFII